MRLRGDEVISGSLRPTLKSSHCPFLSSLLYEKIRTKKPELETVELGKAVGAPTLEQLSPFHTPTAPTHTYELEDRTPKYTAKKTEV